MNIRTYLPVLMMGILSACTTPADVELIYAADEGNLALMQKLIAGGANVNARALDDSTPLIAAIQKHHAHAAQMLLDAGADPNYPSGDLPPLFFAFYVGEGEIAAQLLDKGGRLTIPAAVRERFREAVSAKAHGPKFIALLTRAGYTL